jgi:hypothetical protein
MRTQCPLRNHPGKFKSDGNIGGTNMKNDEVIFYGTDADLDSLLAGNQFFVKNAAFARK